MDLNKVLDQKITDRWAAYNGDSMIVMPTLPDGSIHLSVYSPPFCGLYHYSSSERDLSNTRSYSEFFEMYGYFVEELHRLTMPGRVTAVHCMDVPTQNKGHNDGLTDFPGDIIRLHERIGWTYTGRRVIWNEPLGVRNRTMVKSLTHAKIVSDATQTTVASADYLLTFRRSGDNPVPVTNDHGLTEYAGCSEPPADVMSFRGMVGNQIENRYSQWVWRQYASSVWMDVRGKQNDRGLDKGAVLPFIEARTDEDEKHVHPLQLDIIHRAVQLWSNPGERVFTPFMGVGSEVYEAVRCGRFGIGVELKPSYYRQALRNLATVDTAPVTADPTLFDDEPTLFDDAEVPA
jgi:DNA modification methylase